MKKQYQVSATYYVSFDVEAESFGDVEKMMTDGQELFDLSRKIDSVGVTCEDWNISSIFAK